jgi:hypothetical protein
MNYYNIIYDLYVFIRKSKIIYQIDEESLLHVFDNELHKPLITFTTSDVIKTYSLNGDYSDSQDEMFEFKDAGQYVIYYKFEKEDYETIEDSIMFVIEKADPILSASIESKVYDGIYAQEYTYNSYSADSIDVDNSRNVTINGVQIEEASPITYTLGTAMHSIDTELFDEYELIYKFYRVSGDTLEEIDVPSNAGSYIFRVIMLETANYNEAYVDYPFEIRKKMPALATRELDVVTDIDEFGKVNVDTIYGLDQVYDQTETFLYFNVITDGNITIKYSTKDNKLVKFDTVNNSGYKIIDNPNVD